MRCAMRFSGRWTGPGWHRDNSRAGQGPEGLGGHHGVGVVEDEHVGARLALLQHVLPRSLLYQ
jgi:hypothetical protein